MSELKPTAREFTPSKSWADDDDDDDDEITKQFEALSPRKDTTTSKAGLSTDAGAPPSTEVASLASRISGLSTETPTPSSSQTPEQPSSQPQPKGHETRPKFNAGGNNLFGRALAGAKSDRPAAESSTSASAPKPNSQPEEKKELLPETATSNSDKKDKMTWNIMDSNDDGWGNSSTPTQGQAQPQTEHGSDDPNKPASQSGSGMNESNDGGADQGAQHGMLDERMSETTNLISNDFQVEVKLADLQADPNSPLYSIKEFEHLPIHPTLLKGIYAAGFKKPSKIQEKALPMLLMNPPRNLIGQSQSGTGKTAAFTLNMLSRVDPGMMTPQAICLAPSRELARQIQEVIEKIGQFTQVKCQLAVPGSWSRTSRIEKHILVGTPGTLIDMLSRGNRIFDAKQIRVFVLDEADEMIALQGQGDQTRRIKRMLPPGVQNVLFSATFPDDVRSFAQEFAPEANQIFLKKDEITVDAIKQLYLECEGEQAKYDALSGLYDIMSIGQSIVFCKRKDTADMIAERLTREGHSVASLHGDKQTTDRDDILNTFRDGKTKVLITTNVVARGIDIQQVNMVVNYDVPDLGPEGDWKPDIETYIHRIGRTGRFGRKGCSVIFAHDSRSMEDVQFIADSLGKKMSRINVTRQTDLDQLEVALKAAMKGTDKKPES